MSGQPRMAGGALTLVLVLSACGGESPPADVPELSAALQQVDDAVVDRDYETARDAIDDLAAATGQSLDNGDIDEDGAQRILAAASALTDSLDEMATDEPGLSLSPSPSPSPSPEVDDEPTTEPPAPDEVEPPGESDEDDKDKGGGKGKGKGGGKGKGKP